MYRPVARLGFGCHTQGPDCKPCFSLAPRGFASPGPWTLPSAPLTSPIQLSDFKGLQAPLKGAPLCSSLPKNILIFFLSLAASLTTKLFCLPTRVLTGHVSPSLFPLDSSYHLPVQLLDCLF